MRLSIEITGADELATRLDQAADRLDGTGLREILAAIGEDWSGIFRERITAGGAPATWPGLSPASLARRAGGSRFGGGSARPLLDTGALRDSLQVLTVTDDTLEVGTTLDRAPLLHFGGVTSPQSRIPNAPVPARPFVWLEDQQLDDTVESLRLFFLGDDPVGSGPGGVA